MTDHKENEHVKDNVDNIISRLSSSEFWLRLFYMVIFFFIITVASYVMVAVVIVQFFWTLIAGNKNENILQFSKSLTIFIHQILLFLSQNSDEKPFPFKDWPE